MVKSGTSRDELDGGDATEGGAGVPSLAGVFDAGDGDEADEDVLAKGTSVGRYLVLERLGAGAMGVVYAAYDPELDRKIAIKLLRRQEGRGGDKAHRQERLVREAKAIAKLSHPNVVGVFDVGVHDGQVFMATEYLGGGTLRDWMNAKKRPWRETVKMFIEVGQGLVAAHAEGLIHRDFKPDNVLLDKADKPKVADFGLVRLRSATFDVAMAEAADATVTPAQLAPDLAIAQTALVPLTRTGALAGTPAYMAPEQFLGKPIDARTDQFAFCVALYEALYGERPFAGETVMVLARQVTTTAIRPAPKDSDVPAWLRRILVRGLGADRSTRHPSVHELLALLSNDPVVKRRRRLAIVGLCLAALTIFGVVRHQISARRQHLKDAVQQHIGAARAALDEARGLEARALVARARAFAAFDSGHLPEGERLWAEVLADEALEENAYQKASHKLEAAFTLDARAHVAAETAEVAARFLLLRERQWRLQDVPALEKKLGESDPTGAVRKRFLAPSTITIMTEPPRARIKLSRLSGQPIALDSELSPAVVAELGPGSYQLELTKDGYEPTILPFVVGRGEKRELKVHLVTSESVPPGFAYVPEGDFLFGTRDEGLRKSFLDTVPIHTVRTRAFFVAKHETTFGEWLAFLETLDWRERSHNLPGASEPTAGKVRLIQIDARDWELSFQPWSEQIRVRKGERVRYPHRSTSVSHDWLRWPVTGAGIKQVERYTRWLSASGRVPGARLCDEREWERAARGADDREYPHGDRLGSQDANFDETFGKDVRQFGLEEVGARPASASQFHVLDMAGNAFEFTRSFLSPGEYVARGGSYFQNANTTRSTNRALIDVTTKGQSIGFRVCADVPSGEP